MWERLFEKEDPTHDEDAYFSPNISLHFAAYCVGADPLRFLALPHPNLGSGQRSFFATAVDVCPKGLPTQRKRVAMDAILPGADSMIR